MKFLNLWICDLSFDSKVCCWSRDVSFTENFTPSLYVRAADSLRPASIKRLFKWDRTTFPPPAGVKTTFLVSVAAHTSFCTVKLERSAVRNRRKAFFLTGGKTLIFMQCSCGIHMIYKLFCAFLSRRYLQHNRIRDVSPDAFRGLCNLTRL